MYNYPKTYLSVQDLIKKLEDSGMTIPSQSEAEEAFNTIGYYRLRGYCYHLYDYNTKKYIAGTNLNDMIRLYYFDAELAQLIFAYIMKIEVALRVRFVNAFQQTNDALALNDPAFFEDKQLYWQNQSIIASEIGRSNDVFIDHNFKNHDGAVPLWAAVETLSFGTLSKLIGNLKPGPGSVFSRIAPIYAYRNNAGKMVSPSKRLFVSWTRSVSTMRNLCAHNSRIYNRAINTAPQLIANDEIKPQPRYNGLYQTMLAMKYLRPTNQSWIDFVASFKSFLKTRKGVYELSRMNFPADWELHFRV